MLVLSRKKNEFIECQVNGTIIKLVVVEIRGDKVRLGLEAPQNVVIHRQEVANAIRRAALKPEQTEGAATDVA
jgi:carbon storage regulator